MLSHPESLALTNRIIGSAIEVHKTLGPGLLESTYENCLYFELSDSGHEIERQCALPIIYKSHVLADAYRLDMVVDGKVLVEVKAVEKVLAVHRSQVLTYLKLTRLGVGLLINFNVGRLADGIARISL
jgi:GxxExxY protein